MSSPTDAKIIDLIQAHAKEALTSDGAESPQFQSLEFFPPRTPEVTQAFISIHPSFLSSRLSLTLLRWPTWRPRLPTKTVRSTDEPLPALAWGGTLDVRLGLVIANYLAVITYYRIHAHVASTSCGRVGRAGVR